MITIRLAEADDAAGIKQCVERAYSQYIERLGKKPGPMLDDYSRIVSRHVVYVALAGGSVAGIFVLMENYSPVLLDNLAVDPDFQGTGLGKRLLFLAEDVARDRGHACLQLYTHELMHENIAYYSKYGYQTSHRIVEKGYQRIYMTKDL